MARFLCFFVIFTFQGSALFCGNPQDIESLKNALKTNVPVTLYGLHFDNEDLTNIFATADPAQRGLTFHDCVFNGVSIGAISSSKFDAAFNDDRDSPTNLAHITFRYCSFEGAKLNHVVFGAIPGTTFNGAYLRNVIWKNENFQDLNFDHACFYQMAFKGTLFQNCSFKGMLGRKLFFNEKTTFQNCAFASMHVDHIEADKSYFDRCVCTDLTFTNASLENADFQTSPLERAYIMGLVNGGLRKGMTPAHNPLDFLTQSKAAGNFRNLRQEMGKDDLDGAYEKIFWPPPPKPQPQPQLQPQLQVFEQPRQTVTEQPLTHEQIRGAIATATKKNGWSAWFF